MLNKNLWRSLMFCGFCFSLSVAIFKVAIAQPNAPQAQASRPHYELGTPVYERNPENLAQTQAVIDRYGGVGNEYFYNGVSQDIAQNELNQKGLCAFARDWERSFQLRKEFEIHVHGLRESPPESFATGIVQKLQLNGMKIIDHSGPHAQACFVGFADERTPRCVDLCELQISAR